MSKIKVLLNEEKRIIGYCTLGELENSIEIDIPDDFEIPYKGLSDYVYERKKLKYKPDIEKYKKEKLEVLKKTRDELCLADLEFQGGKFQVRNSTDLNKFERIIIGLIIKAISPEQTEDWRMADNSYKTFTYEELSKIPKLYSDREREIFKKFRELEAKLIACNSIDEINALKWE